ncbi:alpha/beta hydrolase [Alicyclobacillus fodiniaquatilis]|uniref:Alpha/beta hydrolase n=1 Tax=Alicyclobacillus fodiniaquatilis TaxID=1661150 RepID=A0ABW4JIV9_9BACL
MLYAATYPDSVACAIFEGPSFDLEKSFKNMLKKAATLYESIGNTELGNDCLRVVAQQQDTDLLLDEFFRLSQGLGELRMKIYTPGDGNNYSEQRYTESELEEFGRRSYIHLSKLRAEGRIYESMIPRFKNLSMPALLVKGEHDPVICEEQTLAFIRYVPNRDLIVYKNTGHLPHYEQADQFAEDVIKFVQEWS